MHQWFHLISKQLKTKRQLINDHQNQKVIYGNAVYITSCNHLLDCQKFLNLFTEHAGRSMWLLKLFIYLRAIAFKCFDRISYLSWKYHFNIIFCKGKSITETYLNISVQKECLNSFYLFHWFFIKSCENLFELK